MGKWKCMAHNHFKKDITWFKVNTTDIRRIKLTKKFKRKWKWYGKVKVHGRQPLQEGDHLVFRVKNIKETLKWFRKLKVHSPYLFKKDITWFRAEAKRNWKVKVVQVKVNSRCLLPLPERHCPVLGKVGKQLNGEGILESAWRRCNRLVNHMVYVTRIKADVNSPTHSSLT